jgi:hypothetical protein
VAALLGLLGCNPATARVARVDPHVDLLGPAGLRLDAAQVTGRARVVLDESTVWSDDEQADDAHKGAEWHAWETRGHAGAQWTGFRCGCSGGALLRWYDKRAERASCGVRGSWARYCARYPEAATAASTWRCEWELRGSMLTEHDAREWSTLHVRLPEVLRRGARRTRVLAEPVVGALRNVDRLPLHPAWSCVVGVLGQGADRAPRRRVRELTSAAEYTARRYGADLLHVLALQRACEAEGRPGPLDLVQRPDEGAVAAEAARLRKRYVVAPRLSEAALDELVGPEAVERKERG